MRIFHEIRLERMFAKFYQPIAERQPLVLHYLLAHVRKGSKWFSAAGQNTIIAVRAAADNPIQAAANK